VLVNAPGNVSAEVSVQVNGETHALAPGTSIGMLLERLGFTGARIAVAVNRDVVPRSAWDSRRLAGGDRVEILEAVGGGSCA
jgi:sulfur carrier protein